MTEVTSQLDRYLSARRFVEVCLCIVCVPLLMPLMLLIAVLIKCDSKGPIIFEQRRVGRNNELFTIMKFRTMKIDTPDLPTDRMLALPSPITRVGYFLRKSSLDELPQLFNVLRGDMSLIGPRPALYNQDDLIALRTRNNVHLLPPGITGWAQVNGRDELQVEEKVAYDAAYLKEISIKTDIKIIFMTFYSVLSRRGTY